MVRDTRFELVTSAMSRHCSTTELIAHFCFFAVKLPRKLLGRAEPRQTYAPTQVFFILFFNLAFIRIWIPQVLTCHLQEALMN